MDFNPVLRRFHQRFFKTNASGEVVPAAGATVAFYKQGATVKTTTSVEDSSGLPDPIVVPVPVYHPGTIASGDQLQFDLDDNPVLMVSSVSPGAVHVYNDTGDEVIVPAGVRLVARVLRPNAYADPLGTVSLGSSVTADSEGWAECYMRDYRYDFALAGIPVPVLFRDAIGSWVTR